MELKVKGYNELTVDELYEILRVRAEVFVVEQNCVYQDVDNIDRHSLHLFFEQNSRVLAYLRAFQSASDYKTVQIGRVLTVKDERGTGLGGRLLREALPVIKKRMKPERMYLEAQVYATGYYEKEGFVICTEEFLEDGIPHIGMELRNK